MYVFNPLFVGLVMIKNRVLKESMESIDFQGGAFFKALTAAIESVKPELEQLSPKDAATKDLIESTDIVEIVRKYTNLDITLNVNLDSSINASVLPPINLDKNHPLYNDSLSIYLGIKDGIGAIRKAGEPLKAGIDLTTGKVSGYYTKLKSELYLITGMFCDRKFKSSYIAAIILHEIGHIFSFMEYVGYTYRTNVILAATTKAFFDVENPKDRIVVLKEFKKVTDADIDEEKLAATENVTAVQTVLLKAMFTAKRNELNTGVYDKRSFEQLADDFASRQGAAKDLAFGLDLLFKFYGAAAYRSTFTHWALEIIKFSLTIVALGFSLFYLPQVFGYVLVFMVLSFLANDPNNKIYDDPQQRLENIRRQCVEALKAKYLKPNQKAQWLEYIADIDIILKEYNDKRNLYELIWGIFSSRRQAKSQVELQKDLESLAANNLYISANKLQLKGN